MSLRILIDRGSVEVFAGDGRVAISHALKGSDPQRHLLLTTTGGVLKALKAWELKSSWR